MPTGRRKGRWTRESVLKNLQTNGRLEDRARAFQHSLYFKETLSDRSMAGRELQHRGDVAVHQPGIPTRHCPFGTYKTQILAGTPYEFADSDVHLIERLPPKQGALVAG